MYIVKNIERYTSYCPTQWEGETTNGEIIYIRYRWGQLTIDINSKEIFSHQSEDSFDGVMEDEAMKELTKHIMKWT